MNLRSRIDRLAVIVSSQYGDGGDDGEDLADDPDWMAAARSMGADYLREMARERPDWDLARTIAAVDEWEATEPRWWLDGPFGERRWRFGVRRVRES